MFVILYLVIIKKATKSRLAQRVVLSRSSTWPWTSSGSFVSSQDQFPAKKTLRSLYFSFYSKSYDVNLHLIPLLIKGIYAIIIMGKKCEIQDRTWYMISKHSENKLKPHVEVYQRNKAFYAQVFQIWQLFFKICINLQLSSRKRAVVKAEQFINLLSVHTELLNVVHSWLQVNGNKLEVTNCKYNAARRWWGVTHHQVMMTLLDVRLLKIIETIRIYYKAGHPGNHRQPKD